MSFKLHRNDSDHRKLAMLCICSTIWCPVGELQHVCVCVYIYMHISTYTCMYVHVTIMHIFNALTSGV